MDLNKLAGYITKNFPWIPYEDAKEIAQDCFEKWEANPNRRSAALRYVVIDAIRSHTNFSRTRRDSRITLEQAREHSDPVFGGSSQHDADSIQSRRDFVSFVHSCGDLRRDEKMMLILRFLWGFSEKEIAEVCGFSESRACQKLIHIQKEISGRVSSEKPRKRAQEKPRAVSQQIQTGPGLSQESRRLLEEIRQRKGAGVGFGEVPKIPKVKWQRILLTARSEKENECPLQEVG